MSRGELFIVSAPSGTGKTSIIQRLLAGPLAPFGGLELSVSHTTRRPRTGERHGVEYRFVDRPTFEGMIADGRFFEWAEYNDNLYGTTIDEVQPRLARGIDVLLEIEVQGAEQVLRQHPEAHSVFILPPSYQDLERRIRSRNLDEGRDIAGRLAVSIWEIERYALYQYAIINHDVERASQVLAAIILDKRHRLERSDPDVRVILESFQRAVARE
jgi:guanylate kinase